MFWLKKDDKILYVPCYDKRFGYQYLCMQGICNLLKALKGTDRASQAFPA